LQRQTYRGQGANAASATENVFTSCEALQLQHLTTEKWSSHVLVGKFLPLIGLLRSATDALERLTVNKQQVRIKVSSFQQKPVYLVQYEIIAKYAYLDAAIISVVST
jgi:hypothetical protein